MIDTNISIGRWPFRTVLGERLTTVTKRLRQCGVSQAWTGSLDGLFDRDVATINTRLAETCEQAGEGLLLPFGTINPTLPDWEEDLRRCHEVHKFRGIRLHPGFHGYELKDPVVGSLLNQATERKLVVQLAATMEDERTQHPVFRVSAVDFSPLLSVVKSVPNLRMVLLNVFRKLSLNDAAELASTGRVWFDIAMLEGVDRVAALAEKVNPSKIVFGSHFPLFYVESAVLKLRETTLPAGIVEIIKNKNAQEILQD